MAGNGANEARTLNPRASSDLLKRMMKYKMLYVMLLPAIVFLFIFNYIPMYGATIAFKEFWITKGIFGSPWVGLDHFKKLFETDKFWQVFRNTIEINLLRLVFGFPAPILLAILLNEVRQKRVQAIDPDDRLFAPFHLLGHDLRHYFLAPLQ
ncbi:hypothetical protein OMP38_22640 [Cohnella ginsengisoli]|uniref:Sugar ABC transporter permease n=1 Tax=Cohnella ginsengisoli TaxID=425004 RepID=A0A9X4KKZ4_9BACL|nr:hypothetical protein [Cohnella ginsengisoli]MDG0793329.1 hypothetical protein [Cohnella ginsengisoli]